MSTSSNVDRRRIGRGRPVIFDEERFPKPYLELRKDTAVVDLSFSLPENDEHLKKAFENHYQESTSQDILSSNCSSCLIPHLVFRAAIFLV